MPFSDGIVDALDPGRLRLLVEVKRRGSISAAADVCRMGQPSATKHLQTTEAAVGDISDKLGLVHELEQEVGIGGSELPQAESGGFQKQHGGGKLKLKPK